MRAVLFKGTPEEFARVEAMLRAGGDPTVQSRSIVPPQRRSKAWPDLDWLEKVSALAAQDTRNRFLGRWSESGRSIAVTKTSCSHDIFWSRR